MNAERLNEIRKRWAVRWSVGDDKWIWEDHHEADKAIAKVVSPEHATSIAAAPTDIADLLAEVERMRAVVDAADSLCDGAEIHPLYPLSPDEFEWHVSHAKLVALTDALDALRGDS